MTGLAGFDFQRLNVQFLSAIFQQPVNLAAQYGVSIIRANSPDAWRCIGVYHLPPDQNRGRHNVFIEVLDEHGNRTNAPLLKWTVWMDASAQSRRLDKPANEPAADIPIEVKDTITVWIEGDGLPSDTVGNIHTRHADEGSEKWNSYGHHSVYVVFQRQRDAVVTPPTPEGPTEPTQPPTLTLESLAAQVAELQAWRKLMEGDGR